MTDHKRQRNLRRGLCADCGDVPPVPGGIRCESCRSVRRVKNPRRIAPRRPGPLPCVAHWFARGDERLRLYGSQPAAEAKYHPGLWLTSLQPVAHGKVLAEHAQALGWLSPAEIAREVLRLVDAGWEETDATGKPLEIAA